MHVLLFTRALKGKIIIPKPKLWFLISKPPFWFAPLLLTRQRKSIIHHVLFTSYKSFLQRFKITILPIIVQNLQQIRFTNFVAFTSIYHLKPSHKMAVLHQIHMVKDPKMTNIVHTNMMWLYMAYGTPTTMHIASRIKSYYEAQYASWLNFDKSYKTYNVHHVKWIF